MYTTLLIFASVMGLFAVGAVLYTAWVYYRQSKRLKGAAASEGEGLPLSALLRTTVLDYALLLLILIGLVFLLADLVGVFRQRDLYPYWHLGYLLSGIVFTAVGSLLMLVRFFLVLRLAQAGLASPHHQHEPGQADHAE